MPAAQATQADAAATVAYVPAAHAPHPMAPVVALLYVPGLQAVQPLEPVARVEYSPWMHAVQPMTLLAAVSLLYEPAAHAVHREEPGCAA